MMKLNRLFLSQNISIDNALSMNQILHQIVNQIKEIVDFINNLELRANEYTDQEILKLKNNLESQLATLEQTLKTYTNDKIDEYDVDVINPQLTEIRNTIDTINRTLNARIDNEVGILNRRIDSEVSTLNRIIEDTKTYLEDLIKKGMSYVYSSISGLHLPLQDVLGEIGNVLKQSLSYNWNSIDEFKSLQFIPSGYTDIPNSDYGYKDESNGFFWNFQISNDNLTFNWYGSGSAGIFINNVNIDEQSAPFEIPLSYFTEQETVVGVYSSYGQMTVKILNKNIEVNNNITFNSIKTAMEYLQVNYNSLAYTGVNTFYELNETEKLFDTDGVKSDYFTGNKYKVIHNNFDSDFFAYEEEENNENEGE